MRDWALFGWIGVIIGMLLNITMICISVIDNVRQINKEVSIIKTILIMQKRSEK
jgi:hypothetical protein